MIILLQGAVSPDHIPMLGRVPPQLVPAKLVRYLQGRSSRLPQDEFLKFKKHQWGQHLWRGEICTTVDAVTTRRSIKNQQWDDPGENFKITAPSETRGGSQSQYHLPVFSR